MPDAGGFVAILAALAALALAALIVMFLAWQRDRRRSQARIEQLLTDHARSVADARRESVERSRSSLKGQIAERMAPLLPGFPYHPADARFLGDPIDYLVFDGYTAVRDDHQEGAAIEIVLLEVKEGGSTLSPIQRAVARSVEEGRIRFEISRIMEDGRVLTEAWRPKKARG